jgi:hypothetical protein
VVGIVLAEVESLAAVVSEAKGQGTGNLASGSGLLASGGVNAQALQERQNLSAGSGQAVGHSGAVKAPLTAREFAASYNATLKAKTGNAELDRATAGLEIHAHGKLARWATAGVLK